MHSNPLLGMVRVQPTSDTTATCTMSKSPRPLNIVEQGNTCILGLLWKAVPERSTSNDIVWIHLTKPALTAHWAFEADLDEELVIAEPIEGVGGAGVGVGGVTTGGVGARPGGVGELSPAGSGTRRTKLFWCFHS